jgi:ABC-type multidrug transport system ATPase subunit
VPDRERGGQTKTLLDHVSFKALPGDMIALMGPSGAGKTTLLLVLNGYLPPTSGQVRINGEDLYLIYENLRGVIGYVPQDDIVHAELTVFEAVRYSARFRLPPDTSGEEIDRRVEATLDALGLGPVRNLQIGKPEKKVLSGGQRKRVNIAMELVTDPVILFLDEPTSGLAADDTAKLIGLLATLTKRTGKTVIMTIHQPAKPEFELFDLMLLMGAGGVPTYFGPTKPDAYEFFGAYAKAHGGAEVRDPHGLFEVLTLREKQVHRELLSGDARAKIEDARGPAARQWRHDFYGARHPIQRRMYGGDRAIGQASTARGPKPSRPATTGQLGLLVSRYLTVKRRDVVGTSIMLLQAPIIGGLLTMVFRLARRAPVRWCGSARGADQAPAIFFVVVAAVWFGTSNAAREIVGERAIYLRERMVNLQLFNYVASKFLVLSLLCLVQCTVLLAIVSLGLGLHGGGEAFAAELAALVATSTNGVALGLLLSTMVTSTEAAMALTPLALIPQVVLGGFVVPMSASKVLGAVMNLMPARWGFQAVLATERTAIAACAGKTVTSSAPPLGMGMAEVPSGAPVVVLVGMSALMLVTLLGLLRRRDPL